MDALSSRPLKRLEGRGGGGGGESKENWEGLHVGQKGLWGKGKGCVDYP